MTIFRYRAAIGVLAAVLAGPAGAQDTVSLGLPSGAEVTLLDVITNIPGQGLTYRFRFLAPHIVVEQDYEITADDMQFLCDSYALPRLSVIGPVPNEIVITLLDQPVVFGEISPDSVQFFEAYSPEPQGCSREDF